MRDKIMFSIGVVLAFIIAVMCIYTPIIYKYGDIILALSSPFAIWALVQLIKLDKQLKNQEDS